MMVSLGAKQGHALNGPKLHRVAVEMERSRMENPLRVAVSD